MKQAEVLLALIEDLGLADRIGMGWSVSEIDDVCYWEGVDCDSETESTIVGIFLPSFNVTAQIPAYLSDIKTLREISFPNNRIFGTIPDEIAAMPNLEVVNLGHNRLTGTVPTFKSPSIKTLEVNNNYLAGPIPDDFGVKHSNIEHLDLSRNMLDGSIPDSIGHMVLLDSLGLSENRLTGTIPAMLGKLDRLRFLYLDQNALMGTIPPSMSHLQNLEYLWLQSNNLSGTVPATLSEIMKLQDFYIDGNKLTGTIPEALCMKKLNNDFSATPPGKNVDLCQTIACPVGHFSQDGLYPCTPCPNVYTNPYLGKASECVDTWMTHILDEFYKATNSSGWKKEWDLSEIHCDQYGVECDGYGNIVGLDLKNNGLVGTIPAKLGFLKYLKHLDLSDNDLTGFIPSDLRWAPLERIDISGNRLKGVVPIKLCSKPGVNGELFGCDKIACPLGYHSPTGHGVTDKSGDKCISCKGGGGAYLGSKKCTRAPYRMSAKQDATVVADVFGFFFFTGLLVAICMYVYMKTKKDNEHLEFKRVGTASGLD